MKNIFNQTICDREKCPAYNTTGYCNAHLGYLGRLPGPKYGLLCKLPEQYKLTIKTGEIND